MTKILLILLLAFHTVCYGIEILHLSFHRGCLKEFEGVAKELNISVTNWYIPDLPEGFFDPGYKGNALYNVGHDRATRIWKQHAPYFNQFDAVVVSDTSALSRIFLQNGFQKPLVIWISNRFDYSDTASLDCKFPDREYYDLINRANDIPNVALVATTRFEHIYAQSKGVNTGRLVINPCGFPFDPPEQPLVPEHLDKRKTFFLPSYQNEQTFLVNICAVLQIDHYNGPFGSPLELKDFKGIIHLPYSYCNIALFMNMQLGIPYFVPSQKFLAELLRTNGYWHQNSEFLTNSARYDLSEWYTADRSQVITYFDSWADLKNKIDRADFGKLSQLTLEHAKQHKAEMLSRWRKLFMEKGLLIETVAKLL
jgi:hypothetical protein